MSLYFVDLTGRDIITSFYTASNSKYNPLGEEANWKKSHLLQSNIHVDDETLASMDESIMGYMDGKLVVQDAEKIKVGDRVIIEKQFKHQPYSFEQGRDCYYFIGYRHVYRVCGEEIKSADIPVLNTVYEGELYYALGKSLYKLNDEMNTVPVHEYRSKIDEVKSIDDYLLVRCYDGIYLDHELIIAHELVDGEEFYYNDTYISIDNQLYDTNGKLLYTLDGNDKFTNIVEDYAIINDSKVFHIPTRRIVYGGYNVTAYYV